MKIRKLNKKQDKIYFDFIKKYNLKVVTTLICEDFSLLLFEQNNEDKIKFMNEINNYFDCSDFELLDILSNYYLLIFEF